MLLTKVRGNQFKKLMLCHRSSFSHHHMICLCKSQLHLHAIDKLSSFSLFQKCNNSSLSFKRHNFVDRCKLRMYKKNYISHLKAWQRELFQTTLPSVSPLLLLWLQLYVHFTHCASFCVLEAHKCSEQDTICFLLSHHSSKDIQIMNNICFDSVCNPRGAHIRRIMCTGWSFSGFVPKPRGIRFRCLIMWVTDEFKA